MMTTKENSAIEPAKQAALIAPPPGQTQANAGTPVYRPPTDFYDLGDRYELHVDLPGATQEDIDVTLNDSVLSIRARVANRQPAIGALHTEFGVGDFSRQIRLGEDIDVEALSAKYDLGVLTLSLPKRPERRARKVPIRAE